MREQNNPIPARLRAYVGYFTDLSTATYGVAEDKIYTRELIYEIYQYVKKKLMTHVEKNDPRALNRFKIISGLWKAIQTDNNTPYENNVVSAVLWAEQHTEVTRYLLRQDGLKRSDFYQIWRAFKDKSSNAKQNNSISTRSAVCFFEEDTSLSAAEYYNLEREYHRVSRMDSKTLGVSEKEIINKFIVAEYDKFINKFKSANTIKDRNTLFQEFLPSQIKLIRQWRQQLDSHYLSIDFSGLDFSEMDLSSLDLRNTNLYGCNFALTCLDNVKVNASQFLFARGMSTSHIDKNYLTEIQNRKRIEAISRFLYLERKIENKKNLYECINQLYVLRCNGKLPAIDHLDLRDLRIITKLAMGCGSMNVLPATDDFNESKINNDEVFFETLTRDSLLKMLEHMLMAREMQLCDEVIAFNVYERLDRFFLNLAEEEDEIKIIRLVLASLPEEETQPAELSLCAASADLNELKSRWEEKKSIVEQNVLTALMERVNHRPDCGLGFDTETRITSTLAFAKGHSHLVVDLRKVDLMRFTPELLEQIEGVRLILTEEQSQRIGSLREKKKVNGEFPSSRAIKKEKVNVEFPLHRAIKAGDVAEVKRCLEAGEKIYLRNDKQEEGFESTLDLVIAKGNLEILNILVKSSGEVQCAIDARSIKNACLFGHREIASFLHTLVSSDENGRPPVLDAYTIDFLENRTDPVVLQNFSLLSDDSIILSDIEESSNQTPYGPRFFSILENESSDNIERKNSSFPPVI